jgi:hypothetical protein
MTSSSTDHHHHPVRDGGAVSVGGVGGVGGVDGDEERSAGDILIIGSINADVYLDLRQQHSHSSAAEYGVVSWAVCACPCVRVRVMRLTVC